MKKSIVALSFGLVAVGAGLTVVARERGLAVELRKAEEFATAREEVPSRRSRYDSLVVQLTSQEKPLRHIEVAIQTPVIAVLDMPIVAESISPTALDQDGRYLFHDVPKENMLLLVSGPDLFENYVTAIPNSVQSGELTVLIPLRCEFEVEFPRGTEKGYSYQVVDPAGNRLPFRKNFNRSSLNVLNFETLDTAAALLIFKESEPVQRLPLILHPDKKARIVAS